MHVNPSTGFTSYDVEYTGDFLGDFLGETETLRADHFLTLVDVSEEVEFMMPTVAAEAEALLALRNSRQIDSVQDLTNVSI